MNRLKLYTVFLLVAVLALVALVALYANNTLNFNSNRQTDMRNAGIIVLPQTRALPKLDFQSTEGHQQNTSELEKKWYLIYFGYTYCPDICPTSLAELRQIYYLMPEAVQQKVQILLVSVDPDRDTPEQLRAYLNFFEPRFQGWSGELADVQTLSNALGIPFIPGDTSQPGYTVDHSGNLAIVDAQGRQFGFVQAPFNIVKVAEQMTLLIQETP